MEITEKGFVRVIIYQKLTFIVERNNGIVNIYNIIDGFKFS